MVVAQRETSDSHFVITPSNDSATWQARVLSSWHNLLYELRGSGKLLSGYGGTSCESLGDLHPRMNSTSCLADQFLMQNLVLTSFCYVEAQGSDQLPVYIDLVRGNWSIDSDILGTAHEGQLSMLRRQKFHRLRTLCKALGVWFDNLERVSLRWTRFRVTRSLCHEAKDSWVTQCLECIQPLTSETTGVPAAAGVLASRHHSRHRQRSHINCPYPAIPIITHQTKFTTCVKAHNPGFLHVSW